MPDDIRISEFALPGILQEIARFSTPEVAIALARKWGGRRLYVPQSLGALHPLAKAVGRKAALLICAHFGGEQIAVPAARTYLRWHDARRLKALGHTTAEISRAIGVSERQTFKLLLGFEPCGAPASPVASSHAEICPVCNRGLRHRKSRRGDDKQLRFEFTT
jgi:hypothetical protein